MYSRTSKKPKRKNEEDQGQRKLCVWLDKNNVGYYAIPNGGKRNYIEACKFKNLGVKPGVPDICIPIPTTNYHGMYIEMKKIKGGKVSVHQESWIKYLTYHGYRAVVANGCDEAIKYITEYFNAAC